MPNPYKLELSPAAKRDLKRLPLSIQKDIVFKHLPEIEKNP
jgi:mRNA-degrading endonuclease RelE of RelBE toxin-antitoxin system